MQVQPYLFFDGRCEEAIEFYRRALGAEVAMLMRWKDSPEPLPEGTVPPGNENKVMHASLRIGDTTVMASDGALHRRDELSGVRAVARRSLRCRGEAAVRCAERWRPGADAAGQDVLRVELRHGRRPVRRVVDGDTSRRTEGRACVARVAFTANLQRHLSCPVQTVPGNTVRAVLDGVFAAQPRLRSYILDDQDRVRRHVAIYINGERIADRDRLSDPVGDADEVFVFQALSGG